jgi:hypothetical protein
VDSTSMANCTRIVRKVYAGSKEGLKERDHRASKKLKSRKGDAIASCFFEGVRLFENTSNFQLNN